MGRKNKTWLAKNKCLRCDYDWVDVPGSHTKCPMCDHIYAKWTNYEETFGKLTDEELRNLKINWNEEILKWAKNGRN